MVFKQFRDAHALREASTGHHLQLMAAALPVFRAARRILEVGPGRALFAHQWLRDKQVTFYEPYGPAAAALEKDGPPQWHIVRADVRNGISGGPFDVVYASHIIEHLERGELYKFLKDADRVLAPGGYLVIAAPILWAHFYADLTHVRPYMPHAVTRYLQGGYGDQTWTPVSASYSVARTVWGYEDDHGRDDDGNHFERTYVVWDRPFYAARWWLLDGVLRAWRWLLWRCGVRLVRRNSWLLVMRKGMA